MLTGRENLEMMARLLHLPGRTARPGSRNCWPGSTWSTPRPAGCTYSGGMKRRLDLAISMIERPELIFLDEPTTGLDTRSREQVWGTVRRLVDDGVTVLLTTQYLEEADQLADTIALLDSGRIVAQGTAEELKSSLGAEVVRLQFADATPTTCRRRARPGPLRRAPARSRLPPRHRRRRPRLLGRLDGVGAPRQGLDPTARASTTFPSLTDLATAPSTELQPTR